MLVPSQKAKICPFCSWSRISGSNWPKLGDVRFSSWSLTSLGQHPQHSVDLSRSKFPPTLIFIYIYYRDWKFIEICWVCCVENWPNSRSTIGQLSRSWIRPWILRFQRVSECCHQRGWVASSLASDGGLRSQADRFGTDMALWPLVEKLHKPPITPHSHGLII